MLAVDGERGDDVRGSLLALGLPRAAAPGVGGGTAGQGLQLKGRRSPAGSGDLHPGLLPGCKVTC